MNDAGPSNSPGPARRIGATDEQLSAELRKWTGATPALHPVGELLDRHWEAASAYARLCTDGPRSAGILTTAAFTRIFGETLRQTGPTAAWRPHLLVTVRRIAAEWATDHRRDMLHPELLAGAGEGERVTARLLPQQHRRLLSGAFQRLPQSARCLLWHVEVEAEPLAAPAGLLGLDEEGARVELDRARDRLREESLQLHRELAPDEECRRYLRLLDVTYRRGGLGIDPDLRAHIQGCGHCAAAADQLGRFNHGLGLALAEAVLGWGGLQYAESRSSGVAQSGVTDVPRPGTQTVTTGPGTQTAAGPGAGLPGGVAGGEAFLDPVVLAGMAGESFTDPVGTPAAPTVPATEKTAHAHDGFPAPPDAPPAGGATPGRRAAGPRTAARRSAHKAPRRPARRRNLTVSILTVSGLVVIPLVLWSLGNSGEGTRQAGAERPSETPGSGAAEPTGDPSWVGSGDAEKGALRGRLHNVDSGLCVGVEGAKAVEDAEAELTPCSSAAAQQWTYETDGLLRNGAAPGLCLDSHLGYSVRLAPCVGASRPDSKNIRYDFTLQGALVPRWSQDLALAPAATDGSGALVLKTRADDEDQRWVIDTSKADLQMEAVNWHAAAPAPRPTPTPTPSKTPTATPTPTPSATPPAPRPTPTGAAPTDTDCDRYGYPCDGDGQYGYPGYGYGYPGYGHGGYGYGGGRR
ncbi:ricin-type beta-trefoil lectin domain protein [Streptomyces afghaniensis]|uniref:ricin-type beta-trefoil lectin domain protein n=1 Tax=Streptomyces afghaniensis TaxID=66865 RepID=UPI0027869AEB|nr:ricin-type beta-trefoil lectin domain protein [Streptomyces afghaniensis]MDQ1021849.1 DNA-directed RNA polymerase specialized sigma24 family protein [Streptomyces afghaniensis]